MKILISIIAIYCIVGGYKYVSYKLNLKEDNVVEEFAEDFIEDHFDVSIELTPDTPE